MLCPLHTVECRYIFFCISKDAVCVNTEFSCWMVWSLWVRSCHKILQLLNNMVHVYSETDTVSNRHDCHTISSWIALCKYGLKSNYFHSEKPQAIPFHDLILVTANSTIDTRHWLWRWNTEDWQYTPLTVAHVLMWRQALPDQHFHTVLLQIQDKQPNKKLFVGCLTLKMKALWCFKMLGTIYQTAQHKIQEDLNLQYLDILGKQHSSLPCVTMWNNYIYCQDEAFSKGRAVRFPVHTRTVLWHHMEKQSNPTYSLICPDFYILVSTKVYLARYTKGCNYENW